MQSYLTLLARLLKKGHPRPDRTCTGIRSLFGEQLRFDLSKGFPILTTKKIHLRSVIHELLWFLGARDSLNVCALQAHDVHIWNDWADEQGNLGPLYGAQWNAWQGADGQRHDQIQSVIDQIKSDPYSRRLVVSCWNVGELPKMRLLPCHVLFQFYVTGDKRLSCQLYQRSADAFLGLPFNIASYALLTMMMAQVTGYEAGELIHTLGDVHLYENHLQQAEIQLKRRPFPLPHMQIDASVRDIRAFRFEHFELRNYQCHPTIKAQVAV